jgi:hypothetical protein
MEMLLLILAFFIALVLAMFVYHLMQRVPRLPRTAGDWGAAGSDDPRIAVAAMMYAVVTEDGPLTAEKERHVLTQLTTRVGLERAVGSAASRRPQLTPASTLEAHRAQMQP